MHVLITGAHGQLGNELKCLFESGVSEIGPIPEVFVEPDVDYTDADELDITSAEAVNTWFDQHERYNVVINCARPYESCTSLQLYTNKACSGIH